MKPPRIVSAQVIDERNLLVKFTNDDIRKYNISKLLNNPMFAPLANLGFFRNFQIEPGGYGLVWNEDIDISEYELWQNGTILTEEEDDSILEYVHHVIN